MFTLCIRRFSLLIISIFFSINLSGETEEFVNVLPFQAGFLCDSYKIKQGQTVRAQIKVNKHLAAARVKFLSNVYRVSPVPQNLFTYECYIPIECECKVGIFPLIAEIKNKENEKKYIKTDVVIEKKNFQRQHGLKKRRFIGKKNSLWWLQDQLASSPRKRFWNERFEIPTKVLRYSSPFGEIRRSPSWGLYFHRGVDIVAPHRFPVTASQDGVVIVKKRCPYSGNFVVVDHGLEVFTYYLHLDSFADINVGDFVKKGDCVGRVGNTGHSTGYHLHWGLSVHNEPVDPLEWTTEKFD